MFKKKEKVEAATEEKEVEEMWNCGEQGHDYEVIYACQLLDEPSQKVTGVSLYIECKHCKEREHVRSSYGTTNEIHNMWLNKKISKEKMGELDEFVDKKWKEFTKTDKKKATKKPVKKAKTKGGK
jgi:hypothetical protein